MWEVDLAACTSIEIACWTGMVEWNSGMCSTG